MSDENPIDKDKTTENPGLLPYAHHVGSSIIKPEDKGRIKGKAMAAMVEQTNSQMEQIYEQMQLLAEQAKKLEKRVEMSEQVYNAEINFEPVIGHVYYLYERDNEDKVLSMIPPGGWGKKKSFAAFLGKVKLLADHTWEVL